MRLGMLAMGVVVAASCGGEDTRWEGTIYPNGDDLTRFVDVGVFKSEEACHDACQAALNARGVGTRGDYECGAI